MDGEEAPRRPWERLPRESSRAYAAFRQYRDLPPPRDRRVLAGLATPDTMSAWVVRYDWLDRAEAWDTERYRLEDERRLEDIRTMHAQHITAGRAAVTIALQALTRVDPAEIPPAAAARLLEIGTRLERDMLTTPVADLQRRPVTGPEDPWDAIARELEGLPTTPDPV